MNKRLYFKICSFAIGGFLVIWSAAFTVFLLKDRNSREYTAPQQVSESVQGAVKNAEIDYYFAHTDGERVCIYEVYTNGYTKLIASPDIILRTLPEEDRKSFEKGIILNDKAALASLIEDFSS